MEIGYVVSELWRLRRWVAVGLIVGFVAALSQLYKLPSMEKKSFEVGAASTEILVEHSGSPLGILGTDIQTRANLSAQTGLYARLIGTPPVKERIARRAGVPLGAIATGVPQSTGQTGREVAAEQRGNELLVEGNFYRILASPVPETAIITISTQAPTGEEAIKLADGAVVGLRDYIKFTAQQAGVARAIRFRQLGEAIGGQITQNANMKVAALAFFGGLFGWAFLVLVTSRLLVSWREAQAAERLRAQYPQDAEALPETVGDDARTRDDVPALTAHAASAQRATR